MKNPIFLFSSLLVAWITMGCLLYEDKCCVKARIKTPNNFKSNRKYFHGIILKNNDGLNLHINDNFIFYKGAIGYLPPVSDSLKYWIQKTTEYLKLNPNKKLKLICRYNPNESSTNNPIDYGLLRAKEIEKLFLENGIAQKQLLGISLRDSLLPHKNNRIYGAFIPLIINE